MQLRLHPSAFIFVSSLIFFACAVTFIPKRSFTHLIISHKKSFFKNKNKIQAYFLIIQSNFDLSSKIFLKKVQKRLDKTGKLWYNFKVKSDTSTATNISERKYDNIVGFADSCTALWPSGKAKVCNTSIPGSIPGGASKLKNNIVIGKTGGGVVFLSSPPCRAFHSGRILQRASPCCWIFVQLFEHEKSTMHFCTVLKNGYEKTTVRVHRGYGLFLFGNFTFFRVELLIFGI